MAPEQLLSDFIASQPYVAGLIDGYTDRFDLGTGELRVGGVENRISFNGFVINKKSNLDAVVVTTIEGLSDADVRDSRDVNPGYDGETAFSSFYGGRTIVLSGFIRSHSLHKLRDMQEGLKSVFAPLDEKTLVLQGLTGEFDLQIKCRKTQPINMSETQKDFQFNREFQVTLRASDFRFTSSSLYNVSWSNGSAFTAEQYAFSVPNLGNYLGDLILKIEGPVSSNGPNAKAISITNNISATANATISAFSDDPNFLIDPTAPTRGLDTSKNDTLIIKSVSGSSVCLASGEYFLVDSAKRTIKKFDSLNVLIGSSFNQLDVNSEWLKIAPGLNPFYVGCVASSNPTITAYYRHTFI